MKMEKGREGQVLTLRILAIVKLAGDLGGNVPALSPFALFPLLFFALLADRYGVGCFF
jgi:hypothetical protein